MMSPYRKNSMHIWGEEGWLETSKETQFFSLPPEVIPLICIKLELMAQRNTPAKMATFLKG